MANNNLSNFNCLTEHWAFLMDDARQVERYALRDPRAAAIYVHRTFKVSFFNCLAERNLCRLAG